MFGNYLNILSIIFPRTLLEILNKPLSIDFEVKFQ